MQIEIGTEIYNAGDMANAAQFGTITEITTGEYGTYYTAEMQDGSTSKIRKSFISPEYKGHHGTRIVTRAAYNAYRDAMFAQLDVRA